MPVTLTLPVALERRPRRRRKRLRRFAIAALLAIGVALLAAGVWLPAKTERTQPVLNRAWSGATEGTTAARPWPSAGPVPAARLFLQGDAHSRPLAKLAIGDVLALERPDGAVYTYEVAALDVVDSERVQIGLDADEGIVVLVTRWPFEAAPVGGSWRYVVTARIRI